MKFLHLSFSDTLGGASRAASRLHKACHNNNIDSRMYVALKKSDLSCFETSTSNIFDISRGLRFRVDSQLTKLQKTSNHVLHTSAFLPSGLTNYFNNLDVDVINFLSIEEIGKLTKPLVWTLHDMWAFSGAEHYTDDSELARWRKGYKSDNRPVGHTGLDIDRWVWLRKQKAWTRKIHIVTPSQWLADCVRQSSLMQDWPVSVIPNTLDVDVFRPWPKPLAREMLGLPQGRSIILFGAFSGSRDQRKGWDLLEAALHKIDTDSSDLLGVVFGQSEPVNPPSVNLPIRWMGRLQDDIALALLYSAADVTVVPSRQDNLPQSATEAQSCGCPVVAFNTGGLSSAVEHQQTGYLATPFDTSELAKGIIWSVENMERSQRVSQNARARAVRLWSPKIITQKYSSVSSENLTITA